MKHYTVVLTILRFISVALSAYFGYFFVILLFKVVLGDGVSGSPEERMLYKYQNDAVVEYLKIVPASIGLYFVAPILSRIITIGSGDR